MFVTQNFISSTLSLKKYYFIFKHNHNVYFNWDITLSDDILIISKSLDFKVSFIQSLPTTANQFSFVNANY